MTSDPGYATGPENKARIIGSMWWPAGEDGKPCKACGFDWHYGMKCSLPWNRPGYFEDAEAFENGMKYMMHRIMFG